MSTQNRSGESKSERSQPLTPAPLGVQEEIAPQPVADALWKGAARATGGDDPLDRLAQRLANPDLPLVQRQALAGQIGRRGGNRFLQRVVARFTAQPAGAVQREEAEAVPSTEGGEGAPAAGGDGGLAAWMRRSWTTHRGRIVVLMNQPGEEGDPRRSEMRTIFLGRALARIETPASDPSEILDFLEGLAVFFTDSLDSAISQASGREQARLQELMARWHGFMDSIPGAAEATHDAVWGTVNRFLAVHEAMYAYVTGHLSAAVPAAGPGASNIAAIQTRLQTNRAQLQRRLRQFRLLVDTIQAEQGAIREVQQGLEIVRIGEMLNVVGGVAAGAPTRSMPSLIEEGIVLGGEAAGAAGMDTGPAVGTGGGSGAGIVQQIMDSGLAARIHSRRAALQCIRAGQGSTTECLLLADMDIDETCSQILRLSRQIEDDVELLRVLQGGRGEQSGD